MRVASSCLGYPVDGVLPDCPLREDEATTNRRLKRGPIGTLMSRKILCSMRHENRQRRLFENEFGYATEN